MGLFGGGGSSSTTRNYSESVDSGINKADYRETEEGTIGGNLDLSVVGSDSNAIDITFSDLGAVEAGVSLAEKALDFGGKSLSAIVEESKVSNQTLLSGVDKSLNLAASAGRSESVAAFESVGKYALYAILGLGGIYFLSRRIK